jgi:4-carboxymuconolactone decarboxylase
LRYNLLNFVNIVVVIMVSDRYDRGFEKLKEIDGEAGERVIESLKDISPPNRKSDISFLL